MRRYKMHISERGIFVISALQTGSDRRYPFADEGYRTERVARARLGTLRKIEQRRQENEK